MGRILVSLSVIVMLLAASSAGTASPLPSDGPADMLVRPDADGGRTVVALLEDGAGGEYRHVPLTDETLASHTDALSNAGAALDPVIYGEELREVGGYVHEWSLDGSPYTTLGVYVLTNTSGLLRFPVVAIENVSGLDGAARLIAEALGEEALTYASAAAPFAAGMTVPDSTPILLLGRVAFIVLAVAPYVAIGLVAQQDAASGTFNLPPEFYVLANAFAEDFVDPTFMLMFAPAAYLGSHYPVRPDTYRDYPEVRFWTMRKSAAGEEVWAGTYLSRTGSGAEDPDPTVDFDGTKRLQTGPAYRLDGQTHHAAGLYVQHEVQKRTGFDDAGTQTDLRIVATYTVGATAADGAADVPLTRVHMEETRHDETPTDGTNTLLFPDSQRDHVSAGLMVDGEYVPLLGAQHDVTHRPHWDTTNLGASVYAVETERTHSLGAYVDGEYVPIAGSRVWTERWPFEFYALVWQGPGDQDAGDLEASVGVFVDGAYTPVAGGRLDDDFEGNHHDHRSMVSAGVYLDGAYVPLVGTTYDGEQPQVAWTLAHAADAPASRGRWQTSHGVFILESYHPLAGVRFTPQTDGGTRAAQERYELGAYALDYSTFIPVASLDYDGERTSAYWALTFTGAAAGATREGEWDADVGVHTPLGRTPLVGATWRTSAPDQRDAVYGWHATLGIVDPLTGEYVPLVGVSYGGEAAPVPAAAALGTRVAGGGDLDLRGLYVSVGVYDPLTGAYVPLARAPPI